MLTVFKPPLPAASKYSDIRALWLVQQMQRATGDCWLYFKKEFDELPESLQLAARAKEPARAS